MKPQVGVMTVVVSMENGFVGCIPPGANEQEKWGWWVDLVVEDCRQVV